MRLNRAWPLAALSAAALVAGTIGVATAQGSATGRAVSTCDNPTLNKNLDGWGALAGGVTPFRYSLFGTAGEHATAPAAYVTANNTAPNPRAWLPQQPVRPGVAQRFSVDTRTDMAGRARMEVDWYTATGGFLGHDNGPWTTLPGGTPFTWRPLSGEFTPPAGAARANVLSGAELPAGADFSLTGCAYLPAAQAPPSEPSSSTAPPPTSSADPPPTTTEQPPTTEPPASSEPPPPPPPGDQTQAAVRHGWGAPLPFGSDEFNGTSVDTSKWNLPNGCFAGHAGQGRRCAANSVVGGGVLTQIGAPNGDTGWMQSKHNSFRGRWETRMRVADTPGRDNEYHPVNLLWPVAEDFPIGGEVDYAESTATSPDVHFFLHFGASNSQTHAARTVNLREFHNYAVEWSGTCVVGYLDAQEWFRDCNASHLPPRTMKTALQLDYFPDGSAGPGETRMEIDWHRFYPLP